MDRTQRPERRARFEVENVGGINAATVELEPGVTVLRGENATNRTSFLQAVMAAMGSRRATLKGDADAGSVRLDLGEETYERSLTRVGDGVRFDGDPYLGDPEVADLFAFLLEANEARRSVARGDDLRELVMRPVDTDAIEREVARLESEKESVTAELKRVEERGRDLPELERRRSDLTERIEAKRESLADLEADIAASSRDVEESRREQAELEARLDDLRETRGELESVRREAETQREALESLATERRELAAELDDLPDDTEAERETLAAAVADARERRQSLTEELSNLQRLVQYNEERLAEQDYDVAARLADDGGTDSVTDRLLDDDERVVCWTCGSTVARSEIEGTVARLRELRRERLAALDEVKTELAELKAEEQSLAETRERRADLRDRLDAIDAEESERRERQDALSDRREALLDEVERLEAAVDDRESAAFEEVLTLHREANRLEFEVDQLESERESVVAEVEAVEGRLDEAATLRDRRDELAAELTERRTEIERVEREAVAAFNEHVAALLDVLRYDNLDRVWIERVEDGEEPRFELHVVRSTAGGAVYEDTVDHLSESEREVTGLVFALAGYLVHDVHETVPFMLLDSLEAIDAGRIATLVDYFADHAPYLVVALLEEDAAALDDAYDRVDAI
jgi:DNA repair exonuclease SbcCD ATPase subunit